MPFLSRFFQGVVQPYRTLAGGASQGEFNGHHRDSQNNQKKQIEEHKGPAAVLAGHIRKFPDIADADGTAGAEQKKAEAASKTFPFHINTHTFLSL